MTPRWGNKKLDRIVVADDGFELLRGGEQIGWVRFDNILSIEAYKRDELTTDLVCFDILVSQAPPLTWFLHEETPGWSELVEALQSLPGFDAGWRDKVIQPAFAESSTVIYDRLAKG